MARLSPHAEIFAECLAVDAEVGLGKDDGWVFLKLDHWVRASKEQGSWHDSACCVRLPITSLRCES